MDATIYRNPGEGQRDFVRRILHERGHISVMEVLYGMSYTDGRSTALTRLGARVFELRAEGMVIEERRAGPYMTSEYVLVSSPHKVVEERAPWPTAWLDLRKAVRR